MSRTLAICRRCGKPFYGARDVFYCQDCSKLQKTDTVVRMRTCKDCGVTFPGGPRAMRCPDCSKYARAHHKHRPTKRSIGSIDKCVICGKEYTVASGRQMYCSSECQRLGTLAWQREHKKGYAQKSGQDVKKRERRKSKQKICVYCLRPFTTDTSSNLCSAYCREEQKKIQRCIADIKRGRNRNLARYENKRNEYREAIKNDR